MKKKTLVILGSAFAAAALVGGTFAAYAVTDNASPFSVKITPGTIDTGDAKSVTLAWGTKGLINVENLKLAEEKGPYEVGLLATTNDGTAFTGNLSVSLTTTATGELKLIDHLTVSVWEEQAKTNKVLELKGNTEGHAAKKDIVVASGTEKKVYFFVSIDSDVTPLQFESMKEDVVNMTLDWNKGSNVEEVTSLTYYFNNVGNWANVYAYAWNSTTGEQAKAWPGTQMSKAKGAIYSVALETTYDKIIFNNGLEGTSEQKTDDLTVDLAKTYWNNNKWEAAPSPEDLAGDVDYYLVGTMNGWQLDPAYKLTADTSVSGYTLSVKNLILTANTDLKVVSTENDWYGEKSAASDAPNMNIGDAGKYSFYFNPEGHTVSTEKIYIHCVQETLDPSENWVAGNPYVVGNKDYSSGTSTGTGAWGSDATKAYKAVLHDTDKPEGCVEQFKATVAMAKDDEFKVVVGGIPLYWDVTYEQEGGLKNGDVVVVEEEGDSKGNLKVAKAGTFDIYAKRYNDGRGWQVYISQAA